MFYPADVKTEEQCDTGLFSNLASRYIFLIKAKKQIKKASIDSIFYWCTFTPVHY